MADDSIDEDGSWEVVIDDSTVDGAFAKILYFELRGDIAEY